MPTGLPDGWLGAPATSGSKASSVVKDPATAAADVVDLFRAALDSSSHSVTVDGQTVGFLSGQRGKRCGPAALELTSLQRKGASKAICGTGFRDE
ncbi:hypothetical protein LVY72_16145 [Arthrobacter sp. I2-34]|uniref:Uncharacterized protein n=1 Tax=Arthrobacter hankyongi TaxID=2904801 RepID=A0ABS9LAE1_9MICC|nr:hypothetical protein [Arthrobacter hankyongi]MCG2623429.1 hypothetical protein [Arthrobacter hankyongi]